MHETTFVRKHAEGISSTSTFPPSMADIDTKVRHQVRRSIQNLADVKRICETIQLNAINWIFPQGNTFVFFLLLLKSYCIYECNSLRFVSCHFCCRICLQLNHEWHRHKLIPIDLLSKEKKRKEKTIWKFFWMVSRNGSNLMIFSFVTFLVFLCALWLLVPSPWAWFILENENSHPDSFIRDCRWQQF